MAEQYFHLTLGPVQTFVAQARRTRDFWAGSFILSWLSSVAMAAVRQQKGQIEFPVPDDHFLSWLEGTNHEGNAPQQGSVPNRFKALGARVDIDFDPIAVVNAVQLAWQEMADLVWLHDIHPVTGNDSPQFAIWHRQIDHFWELSWCLTDSAEASNLLDRRKNWRSHIRPDEPGVKCSLMEGYQELSGAPRPGEAVRTFWQAIRLQSNSLARDVRDDEHLCAIALVKRRFVHYFADLAITLPAVGPHSCVPVNGWTLPPSVPSIAYLAALPWLAASIMKTHDEPALLEPIEQLQEALATLDAPREGRALRMVQEACEKARFKGRSWQQVNGQYLYPAALQQHLKETRHTDSLYRADTDALHQVQRHLARVRELSMLGEPSPFYAILLMDGDSLGAQMSNPAKQKGISQGLSLFTRGVPARVDKFSGFLVYAGGDDVLALLPQPFALACAFELHQFYDDCFNTVNQSQGQAQITTSISGAIEFAHYKTPLTRILQDAHGLLDTVAKDETGRNSLAVRLWRPGGLNAQWSAPWSKVPPLMQVSAQIGAHLQSDLSRSFFFKLEELIHKLGLMHEHHGFDAATIQALVRAAWVHTGNTIDTLPEGLESALLAACQKTTRTLLNDIATEKTHNQFAAGALRLLQFLATENQRFMQTSTLDLPKERE